MPGLLPLPESDHCSLLFLSAASSHTFRVRIHHLLAGGKFHLEDRLLVTHPADRKILSPLETSRRTLMKSIRQSTLRRSRRPCPQIQIPRLDYNLRQAGVVVRWPPIARSDRLSRSRICCSDARGCYDHGERPYCIFDRDPGSGHQKGFDIRQRRLIYRSALLLF